MNRRQFLNFMQSPDKLNGGSVALLADVVRQFPYCQTAQLLYLKNLHIHKSIHYNHQLKIAAAYSSDRKKLYELVIQPDITSKIHEIESTAFKHTDLEREILKEAVNASIQLEVAQKGESEGEHENLTHTKIQKDISVPMSRKNRKLADKYTFSEWIKVVNKEKQSNLRPKSSRELIDTFIKENPQVIPPMVIPSTRDEPSKKEFFSPVNAARLSIIEDENFITETLAKIYMKQKNYSKAIKAYKILSLQNPENNSNFAARTESIKELIRKEKETK